MTNSAGNTAGVSFARNIQAERERRRLNQTDFGALLGVTQSAVSKWEQAINMPTAAELPSIAAALGVTVDALMAGEPRSPLPAPPPTQHEARTTPDRRALKLFRLISDEGQRHALGALAAFAKAYPRRRAP